MSLVMTTSRNGNIFRVTGPLCGEFTGPGEFPTQRPVTCGALMFSLICAWINDWVNNREADDLRRYRGHYDVIVMPWLHLMKRTLSTVTQIKFHKTWLLIGGYSTRNENLNHATATSSSGWDGIHGIIIQIIWFLWNEITRDSNWWNAFQLRMRALACRFHTKGRNVSIS